MSDSEAPNSDDLATKTLRRLSKGEKEHEKTKARLKRFQLFEDHEYVDYKGETKHIAKAKRRADDGPTLQMMLARRDRYESCVRHIARLEAALDESEGKDTGDLVKSICALEKIADSHARAIESALMSLSKNDVAVQNTRARVLTSAASLAQTERHHADKLELARKQNPGDMPDAELLRIANGEPEDAADA